MGNDVAVLVIMVIGVLQVMLSKNTRSQWVGISLQLFAIFMLFMKIMESF